MVSSEVSRPRIFETVQLIYIFAQKGISKGLTLDTFCKKEVVKMSLRVNDC